MKIFFSCCLVSVFAAIPFLLHADDWPQGSGTDGNFLTTQSSPTDWSVALDQNIAWKIELPETGQSTPVISKGKVFFTTMKPFAGDATTGKDIIAWCCDATNGAMLWQKEIVGKHPLKLSGCFGDSTGPPAVTDGERVVFINASSGITCFSLGGELLWHQDFLSVGRGLPFLHNGNFIFTRQIYPPEEDGRFPHKYAKSPKEMWTQLQALNIKTGEIVWTTQCGINMGVSVIPQRLSDGRDVVVTGRGGGHGPPEKPNGISLVDLADGETLWTLPLEKFNATMSFGIYKDQVQLFHGPNHLSVDTSNGTVVKQVSLVEDVSVCRWRDGGEKIGKEQLKKSKTRNITQTSNLLVGKWNYFRNYQLPLLGRVNVETGVVEYLELPLQLSRAPGIKPKLLWFDPKQKKMETQTIVPNDMTNSRGFVVFGDKRSKGSGWGHVAAPSPTVSGDNLYVPVMNGTVYVLNWKQETFNKKSIVAINDLGLAGKAYTRSSLSFANGNAFAHTLRELICIGKSPIKP
ncbi:PQQ-like beta-propeller repeat protein [Mariniblastus sp.]|nr:PQQ-like beta-propeller repeat protein [bacterium]MDA7880183.1 PQQ-like beta-propeller repeat protein [Mariniblastus sp.]MDB4357404.1 PQQ-like beta-propeller repeat protein [Mariniblastus sp.]MDB4372171.1 PQQ-like beta-propeller repeat protein [Mariniblastus sp.]MDB4466613.1 PQQ-like beta-propeller repeat protein [bacterium]